MKEEEGRKLPRGGKRVTWAPFAKMKHTTHLNEYTAEELQASYLTGVDYKAFKLDAKRTGLMIEMNAPIDEVVCSIRGVEHRTRDGASIRRRLISRARTAVFREQMSQFFDEQEGKARDDERLAALYATASNASVVSARIHGISDEIVANELLSKEERAPSSGGAVGLNGYNNARGIELLGAEKLNGALSMEGEALSAMAA